MIYSPVVSRTLGGHTRVHGIQCSGICMSNQRFSFADFGLVFIVLD